MKEIRLDLGFTSPLKRARETAEIILAGRNIPLIDEERIKEIGFGGMRECSAEEKTGIRRAMRSTAFSRIPEITFHRKNAETVPELYERTGAFLKELCAREDLAGKNILVSTHGAAMTALLNRIKGICPWPISGKMRCRRTAL